eukprot:m.84045 g.84045  ORF g.84045 m.84045 type:complete len:113 (-) comp14373_c0_seq1:347-685(-)
MYVYCMCMWCMCIVLCGCGCVGCRDGKTEDGYSRSRSLDDEEDGLSASVDDDSLPSHSKVDTVTSVKSLGDLTHHYTNVGVLGCVIIKGVQGYCSFLNGIYRRVEDLTYEDR